jgi:hypothetical protein
VSLCLRGKNCFNFSSGIFNDYGKNNKTAAASKGA